MSAVRQKDIGKIRDKRRDTVLNICTVLLAAAIIVLNMLARIEITKLSDESVQLSEEIADLEEQKHTLEVEREFKYSLAEVEEKAHENGMIPPSEIGSVFIDKPIEDKTIVYKTLDKPKDIYAYFGW